MGFFNNLFNTFKGEKLYTKNEVLKLMNLIKTFDAGAVDEPLSRHIDKCYDNWSKEK